MPKVRMTDAEKQNLYFAKLVKIKRIQYDVSMDELAIAMQRTPKTVYVRMANPDDMPLKEFRAIVRKLHLTEEEIACIVGARDLKAGIETRESALW
jgi:hypothetical protein